jgi:BirA family biotin operon repressor/biotin-[acetyl-CoA-carboxylase] ligase
VLSSPGDLSVEMISAHLRTRLIGRRLELHAEAGSTNDLAMAAGSAGAPEGLAVLADRQSAGRGRLGRRWASPSGLGLYVTLLLRPPGAAAQAPLLTLAAGVAACDALRAVAGVSPGLKWPNDLFLDGRKVAGILSEMATTGEAVRHVVVGIGINVHQTPGDFPEELRAAATSLRIAAGRPISRGILAAALFGELERQYDRFCAGEFEAIVAAARARSVVLGRRVEVIEGAVRWGGLAEGMDRDGALLVRTAAGELRRVQAGDVSLRPAE